MHHRTTLLSRSFGAPLLAALVLSCGGGERPPAAPTAAGSATPAGTRAIAEDRTPVNAVPKGVVLHLHTASPRSIARAIKGYVANVGGAIDPREAVAGRMPRPFLAKIVDIEKPVDAILYLPAVGEKHGSAAKLVSAFGVEDDIDVGSILKGQARIEPSAGGVLRLLAATPAEDRGSSFAHRCVIAPAIGAAKHRLICSTEAITRESLDALAGWLARGVTQQPEPTSSLRFDLDVAAIRARYQEDIDTVRKQAGALVAPEVKVGKPEIDRVLKRLAVSVVEDAFDLLGDMQTVSGDVGAAADHVDLAIALELGGSNAWTSKLLLAPSDAVGPAPTAFGKLPAPLAGAGGAGGAPAYFAGFSHASPATDALMAPVEKLLVDLFNAAAADLAWPKKDRDAALDLVKSSFAPSAESANVLGGGPHNTSPPIAARVTAGVTVGVISGVTSGVVAQALERSAWTVGVVDRETKSMVEIAKATASLVTRPTFASLLQALARGDYAFRITAKASDTRGLPKGSFAEQYEVAAFTVTPLDEKSDAKGDAKGKAKRKETPLAKFVAEQLVVPGVGPGARTWTAWGQNLAAGALVARMKEALGGTGPTVTALPGFDYVTRGSAGSAMLLEIDGVARAFTPSEGNKNPSEIFAKLPDHGRSAFAMKSSATKAGAGGTVQIAASIPRDLIALAALAAHM